MVQPSAKRQKLVTTSNDKVKPPSADKTEDSHTSDESASDGLDPDNQGGAKSSGSRHKTTTRNNPKLPPLEKNKYSESSSSSDEEDNYEDSKKKGKSKINKSIRAIVEGCNYNLKPLSGIPEIFGDLTENAVQHGLFDLIKHMNGNALKVGTFCSGTESPILALKETSKALERDYGEQFMVEHKFSAENVAFKQAYIQDNFSPPILYRDITEFGAEKDGSKVEGPLFGTTAFGTRIEVPGGIDLLIAGTSCHDFSILNNIRKCVESNGESGQTFFATLAYMTVYRPKMVIFENVKTAPFLEAKVTAAQKEKNHHALDFYINQRGYATRLIMADSRDYYMPHTRQRGYIICIEERQAYLSLCPNANPNPSATEITEFSVRYLDTYFTMWKTLVKSLSRQASVCVEDMLFEEDDTRLAVLLETEKEERMRKPVGWQSCSSGHLEYRYFHRLGTKHCVTHWYDDIYKLPDHYAQGIRGLTQRVLDFIDICHLMNLVRGFDDRYYSRNLELSQNVYRIGDCAKNGIVGCLTPNGMPFSTTLGRRISGVEAMGLQAMASADLNLAHQTQDNLQNLAGNAMTSTVVGAVMLAGLTVFHKIFDRGTGVVQKPPAVEPILDGEQSLARFSHDPTAYQKLSVEDAISLAGLTARLCPCEETSRTIYQQCKICKHTACNVCGGNPEHDYVEIPRQIIKSRKDPSNFIALLWKSIPRELNLLQLSVDNVKSFLERYHEREKHSGSIDSNTWARTYGYISKALCSELCLRGVNRKGSSWEATYDSLHAKAELKISRHGIEWLIYVNTSEMASGSDLGAYFRNFPFLRMIPSLNGKDIMNGQWQIWHPKESSFAVKTKSYGSLIPTYKCAAGLSAHCNDYTPSKIEITVQGDSELAGLYSGEYRAAPSCGQAFNSLYFRVGTDGLAKTDLFFLDQEKGTGNPEGFSFIFTSDSSRVKPGTYRRYDAKLESIWRPRVVKPDYGDQDILSDQVLIDESHLLTRGSWTNFSDLSVGANCQPPIEYRKLPNRIITIHDSCASQHAVFTCDVALADSEISTLWPRNDWVTIDKSNSTLFKRNFGWALQPGFEHPGFSQSNENWHDAGILISASCTGCSPVAPSKLWALNKKQKMAPFEEPGQAKLFENAMKAIPQALMTSIFINSGGFKVKVGMNPSTLIHRAAARLSGPGEIKSSWLLVTDDPMVKKPNLAPLIIQSSHDEMVTTAPPNFRIHLRPEQLRALGWMKSQENGGRVFLEESISEQRSPSTSMRLWGKATQEKAVNGGILAFEVGFGKTAVTVGLVDSQRQRDLEWSRRHQDGLIPLKATLVYVPKQLTAQWKAEIEKFAGEHNFTIITLEKIGDLETKTIFDLEKADFIIVNMDICDRETYRTRLAYFSGMVEHDKNATPLAKSEWHKSALPYVRKSVDELRKDAAKFKHYLDTTYAANLKDIISKTPAVPSTQKFRLKTGAKRTHGEMSTGSDSRKYNSLASNLRDYRNSKFWVLEALSCSRVVVDEYTYTWQTFPSFSTIKQTAIAADKKWMLSGTPALGNFADVKVVASLLGVELGEDDISMRGHIDKRHVIEMSMMEEFLAMGQNLSPALKERRHAYAQKFLDVYARKDVADITTIAYSEHLHVVRLTPSEFAINLELAQAMVTQNFDLNCRNRTGSNESRYIKDAGVGCEDGREAMVVRASELKLEPGVKSKHIRAPGSMVDDAEEMVHIIIEEREAEYDVVKQKLVKQLEMACWLDRNIVTVTEKCQVYPRWKDRVIEGHQYGDGEVQKEVKNSIKAAEDGYKLHNPALWRDGTRGDTRPSKPEGKCKKAPYQHIDEDVQLLRQTSFNLTKLGGDMINLKRSLRFLSVVRDTPSSSTHTSKGLSCSGCDKHSDLQPDQLTVLSRCGHVVCNFACLEKVRFSGGTCPREDCNAASKRLQYVSGSDLVKTNPSNQKYIYGTKMDHMINILISLPQDAKVLIFIQFQTQMNTVMDALKRAGVSFSHLQSDNSSDALRAFQTGPDTKVLLLNVGDSSAAGSNLTVANHVFFLSPYLTKGLTAQQDYDSTMTQAIGRARRYGQQQHVYVYHFLASKTIDVDIIEKRSSKILKRVDGFGSNTRPFKESAEEGFALVEAVGDETGQFASSAVAEIFSANSEYA